MIRCSKLPAFARNLFGAAAIAALALTLIASPRIFASQASCIMPTTGTVSGLVLVNDINACNQAILSIYSGATPPTSPVAGMLWYNTAASYIEQYDGVAWLNVWYVDASNHLLTPQIGGGIVSVNLASAATVDLGSVPQSIKAITGTTTIASFGSSATVGTMHLVAFSGALTITYNVTSMILPGATDIQTQAGDVAFAIYLGGGRWKVIDYTVIGSSPQMAANSLKGNATGARANPTDLTGASLTQKVTPAAADRVLIFDSAAANAIKWASASSMAALAGVVSIDGQTGLFTTSNGFSCPGNVCGLTAARRTLPLVTVLTASSGTFTTNPATLWLELKLVGGGAGGAGGNQAVLSGAGGDTCWASSGAACGGGVIYIATGALGSSYNAAAGLGGLGGGPGYSNQRGNSGAPGTTPGLNHNGAGGTGGGSCVSGGAPGGVGAGVGTAAPANSGAGGGGGGNTNGSFDGGGGTGGSAGGCALAIIQGPGASYTYAIGPGGTAGTGASINSSAGANGGLGGSGRIEVIEHFGSLLFVFVAFRRRRPANDNRKTERAAA